MKKALKLTRLFTLLIILIAFSCSKDDEVNYDITTQDVTITFAENPTNGDVVGTVEAEGNGTLSFSITSQTPTGALSINETTGELTVADAMLFDFETNPIITANITVSNSEETESLMVTINLSNVNELSIDDFSETIDENPTNGDVIGTVQASGDGTLSYTITSQTPSGALSINATTGELTVADASLFDYETNPTITADVSVDNSASSETATVTINLNNVNELSIQDFATSVDENPTNGNSLGTIQAAGDGTLVFSINSQTPAGALNIDANTGELTVADATLFDYETNPTIDAEIYVTNSVTTEDAEITINLNNINEIGDVAYGGMIFWLDPTDNSQGLVFAFDNQLNNLQWGCSGTFAGATGSAISTGATNTATIISSGCATSSAAEAVSNLNYNGFDDWFLPSIGEMDEIQANWVSIIWPAIQANGGSALLGTNWTSTEDNNNNAFVYYLTSGPSGSGLPKTLDVAAIPVRAF